MQKLLKVNVQYPQNAFPKDMWVTSEILSCDDTITTGQQFFRASTVLICLRVVFQFS